MADSILSRYLFISYRMIIDTMKEKSKRVESGKLRIERPEAGRVPKANGTQDDTTISTDRYWALALSHAAGKLGFTMGSGQVPRLGSLPARELAGWPAEIDLAQVRLDLPEEASVRSGDEAGRDGLWWHRDREAAGIQKRVGDTASMEVNRRARRTKTGRWDVGRRRTLLVGDHPGETQGWRGVPEPKAMERKNKTIVGLAHDNLRGTIHPFGIHWSMDAVHSFDAKHQLGNRDIWGGARLWYMEKIKPTGTRPPIRLHIYK